MLSSKIPDDLIDEKDDFSSLLIEEGDDQDGERESDTSTKGQG